MRNSKLHCSYTTCCLVHPQMEVLKLGHSLTCPNMQRSYLPCTASVPHHTSCSNNHGFKRNESTNNSAVWRFHLIMSGGCNVTNHLTSLSSKAPKIVGGWQLHLPCHATLHRGHDSPSSIVTHLPKGKV